MKITGYAYPWDYLDDERDSALALQFGLDAVALAANYHATRVVTPLHPHRFTFDVPHSAIYFPLREEAWRNQRLQPRRPTWLGSSDSFNEAAARFGAAGIRVLSWLVVTHDDDLGYEHPDLVVRNALGEPYPYALCPAQDDVRSYARTLVEEVLHTTDSRGIVLEACGPFGVEHASTHDKSDMAVLTDFERALLSICFCSACRTGFQDVDVDPDELAASIRAALAGPVTSIEGALGEERASRVASYRGSLSAALRDELVKAARSVRAEATVTVHASASPWATGSFAALGEAEGAKDLASVVVNCWDEHRAETELTAMAHALAGSTSLGAYVRPDRVADSPEAVIERYRSLKVDELHLYHLGLFTRSSLEIAHRLVGAAKQAHDPRTTYDR